MVGVGDSGAWAVGGALSSRLSSPISSSAVTASGVIDTSNTGSSEIILGTSLGGFGGGVGGRSTSSSSCNSIGSPMGTSMSSPMGAWMGAWMGT